MNPYRFAPRAPLAPLPAALLVVGGLAAASAAPAATIEVTTDADADVADALCSLREAIVAANTDAAYNGCAAGAGADRILFSLPLPATIALASDLPTIVSTLTLQGPGADALAIDGQDLHRLIAFDSPNGGEWLGVEELTLTRGLAPVHGGGAFVASGETAWFRRVLFLANRASNGGGGLAVQGNAVDAAVVALDECWLEGNLALGATGGGGLLALGPIAEVYVDGTTLSGNRADASNGSAGGVLANRATVTLTRSTVSGNVAKGSGGGLMLLTSTATATLVLRDSTVTGNQAEGDGDGIGDGGGIHTSVAVGFPATLELSNTLLAGNVDSGIQTYPDVSSFTNLVLVTHGFNLIGSNQGGSSFFVAGTPNADGDWIGTSAAPIDPQLEALAANGGFGPDHRPAAVAGTPVIDQGSCPGSGGDQRGYGDAVAHVRIVDTLAPNGAGSDGCDIGAHERGGDPAADPDLFADDFEAGHALYWSSAVP